MFLFTYKVPAHRPLTFNTVDSCVLDYSSLYDPPHMLNDSICKEPNCLKKNKNMLYLDIFLPVGYRGEAKT